jgi:hypothetical protein
MGRNEIFFYARQVGCAICTARFGDVLRRLKINTHVRCVGFYSLRDRCVGVNRQVCLDDKWSRAALDVDHLGERPNCDRSTSVPLHSRAMVLRRQRGLSTHALRRYMGDSP